MTADAPNCASAPGMGRQATAAGRGGADADPVGTEGTGIPSR